MDSFSIWHWLVVIIPLACVAAVIWIIARGRSMGRSGGGSVKDRSDARPSTGPSGFGGWLILVAIGVFMAPFLTIYLATQLESGVSAAILQRFRLTFNGEIGIFLLVAVLQICTAFFMARKDKRFKAYYIVTGIASILLKPVDILWAASMLSFQSGKPFQFMLQAVAPPPEDVGRWIAALITIGIWILYVTRSRRVANTFIR